MYFVLSEAQNHVPSQESSWHLSFSATDAKERPTHPRRLTMLVDGLEALLKEIETGRGIDQ